MRLRSLLLAFAALALATLDACYSPNIPSGTQACTADNACAPGLICGCDKKCYKPGQEPQCKPPADMAVPILDLVMVCTPASCTGATPQCDPASNQCVACLKDEHCPIGKLCKDKTCVPGCNMMRGCGDAGMCDPMSGTCRVCTKDDDCAGTPQTSRCDVGSGRCVECVTKAHCAGGSFCENFKCAMGCYDDRDCNPDPPDMAVDTDGGAPGDGGDPGDGGAPPPLTKKMVCCKKSRVCVDVLNDTKNCGACETDCGKTSCCNGVCEDTTLDLDHCGACGNKCTGKNATWKCDSSKCAVAGCNAGFGNCNGDSTDGCEVNTNTDPKHCTGCNKACSFPNAAAGCTGRCFVKMCNAGFDNCNSGNPEPVDGCERPVSMDVSNCGMCGKSCPVPMNATSAACANSLCGVGMCKPNFGDCNKLGADGCEANLLTDSANCTKCGMACPPKDHATGKCNNGVCGLGGCEAGWADCNNNPGDGCEIEIAKRVDHCGKCFTPCPAVANGTAACENSQCKVNTCNGGFADCNKVYGDGCEVTLASSSANCGMCGKVCPGNMPVCNGGNCTALFMFSGVRNDVPIASLAGWTECYKDTFAGGQSLGTVMANCSRANILLGCRMINSNTLRVAAHAPRADVFFDTGQNTNVTRVVNGVGWYYNPNQSWGYANGNDPVQKSACDINDAANPTLRLCIHTGGGNMGSGYRCGMDRLNGNNQWERVIYHAN